MLPPFAPWKAPARNRMALLTEEEVTDIILHCRTRADDKVFLERYGRPGMKLTTISDIRLGRSWKWLRRKLMEKTDPHPTGMR